MKKIFFSVFIFLALFGAVFLKTAGAAENFNNFDYLWKNVFHYITFFEGLPSAAVSNSYNGYRTEILGAGLVENNEMNLLLATGKKQGSLTEVYKYPSWQGLQSFRNKSNMRSAFVLNQISGETAYIRVGEKNGYGFKAVNNKLYGFVKNGKTEKTVFLHNIFPHTAYLIEARYLPNKEVSFWTGNAEKTFTQKRKIISNLPSLTMKNNNELMNIKLITNNNSEKSMQVSFFEYLQDRNVGLAPL